jgi:hypothetical protein
MKATLLSTGNTKSVTTTEVILEASNCVGCGETCTTTFVFIGCNSNLKNQIKKRETQRQKDTHTERESEEER